MRPDNLAVIPSGSPRLEAAPTGARRRWPVHLLHCTCDYARWQLDLTRMANRREVVMAGSRQAVPVIKKQPAPRYDSLGLQAEDVVALTEALKSGLSFATLTRFQETSRLPMRAVLHVLQIP